jgi:hypothetical protein
MTTAPNIGALHKQITAVGSRVTCSPAPTDTDQDWLVLVSESDFDNFATDLIRQGWKVGGSLIPNDANYLPPSQRFNSFTLGVDNVIATASTEFHNRFLSASATAKRLNLLSKDDRITLFQSVLYAAICDPAFQPAQIVIANPITELDFS